MSIYRSAGSVDRVPLTEPALDERERERVSEVVATGQLRAGETVTEFERRFAEFCGTDAAVATASGTAALQTALQALDIGAGDRVLTSPFAFVAGANAIRLVGAEPVYADIDYETYNLDPHAVERTVRDHDGDIDALLAVHLYGLPAPMDHLGDIADRYDMALVEDAAQAHGAKYDGSRVGSLGDAGCFSFHPTTNMTTGDGGIVVTDRDDVARRARQFVDHGRDGEGRHAKLGHDFRMTDLAAAIGLVQLQKLSRFNRARRAHAKRLTEGLEDTAVIPPSELAEARHVYQQYTIRTADRDTLETALADAGIETAAHYSQPLHQQPAYDHGDASFPVTERAAREVLSLPVHPDLTTAQIDHIVTTIRQFFADRSREERTGAATETGASRGFQE